MSGINAVSDMSHWAVQASARAPAPAAARKRTTLPACLPAHPPPPPYTPHTLPPTPHHTPAAAPSPLQIYNCSTSACVPGDNLPVGFEEGYPLCADYPALPGADCTLTPWQVGVWSQRVELVGGRMTAGEP